MEKKGRLVILSAAVAVSFVSAVFPALADAGVSLPADRAEQTVEGAAREYPETEDNKYILREHEGCISVFYGEERIKETDIEVALLREHDREVLSGGIAVETYGEMLALLEDFDS